MSPSGRVLIVRLVDDEPDGRELFEEVSKAYGLEAVFDNDYQPVSAFRFQLTEADYRQALRALEVSTSSFIVPLSSRRFLVARDNPQKRTDLEPTRCFALSLDVQPRDEGGGEERRGA